MYRIKRRVYDPDLFSSKLADASVEMGKGRSFRSSLSPQIKLRLNKTMNRDAVTHESVIPMKKLEANINNSAIMKMQSIRSNVRLHKSPHYVIRSKKENVNSFEKPKADSIFRPALRSRQVDSTKRQSTPMLLINNVSQSDFHKNNIYRIQLIKTVKKLDMAPRKQEKHSFF